MAKFSGLLKQSGAGLVELALAIPVIFILFAGGLELAFLIRTNSRLTTLSREITSAAFRECANQVNPAVTSIALATAQTIAANCLLKSGLPTDKVFTPFSAAMANTLDASKVDIVLTVYRWEPGPTVDGDDAVEVARVRYDGDSAGPASSRIEADGRADIFKRTIDPVRYTLIQNHQVLVYTEIFYQYSPWIVQIPGLIGASGGMIYVTSVF